MISWILFGRNEVPLARGRKGEDALNSVAHISKESLGMVVDVS
jgi:hypothetical protein